MLVVKALSSPGVDVPTWLAFPGTPSSCALALSSGSRIQAIAIDPVIPGGPSFGSLAPTLPSVTGQGMVVGLPRVQ